jgi:dihydroxy-acid dehydratase
VEADLEMDVITLIEKLADDSALICYVRPNGPHRIEELEEAGGTLGVMKQLQRKLDTDVNTVSGKELSEVLAGVDGMDEKIIRPFSRPFSKQAGLLIIRGNLAPDGAIVKASAVSPQMWLFEGPARVYEDEEQALSEIDRIKPNEVVVLRGMGPKGGPGTVFACAFVAAVNGAGISQEIAVVTDGELSGLNRGLTIGQVMPEAAEGGPLAVVRPGERIRIDLNKRRIDLLITKTKLKERLARWRPQSRPMRRSWLSMYAQLVQPISKGAVLGEIPKAERFRRSRSRS